MQAQQKPYRGISDAKHLRLLEKDEMRFLLRACLADKSGKPAPPIDGIIAQHFPLAILYKRMQSMVDPAKVATNNVLIFIAFLSEFDRPGIAVIWCYSLMLWSSELGRPITMDDMCLRYIPQGVPTLAACRSIWMAQKVDQWLEGDEAKGSPDNMLDRSMWWKPIIEKINARELTDGQTY